MDGRKAVGRRVPVLSSGCNDDNHAEFDAVGMQFVTEDGLVVLGCSGHLDVVVVNTCNDCGLVMYVCAVSRIMLVEFCACPVQEQTRFS